MPLQSGWQMIITEIKNIKGSKKDLRKFGVTVGIVLLIISGFLLWKQKENYFYFVVIGAALLLSGLIFPVILKPLNKIWMTLAILMGWVTTRVILTILFYLVLTPLAFAAKIFGKSFLDLKIDKSKTSYWEYREKPKVEPSDYEKQF